MKHAIEVIQPQEANRKKLIVQQSPYEDQNAKPRTLHHTSSHRLCVSVEFDNQNKFIAEHQFQANEGRNQPKTTNLKSYRIA
jgi:hypothetical protein